MSHENRHIILRQVIDLELNAKPRGDRHAIAEETSRLCKEVAPKAIERSFSKVIGPDEFLTLDLLEVELEVDSMDQLEEAMREQLPALLDEALRKAIQSRASSLGQEGVKAGGHAEWIIHFLEQAYLPWSAPQELSLAQLRYYLSELLASNRSFAQDLQRLLLKKRQALKRFLYHFGEKVVWQILIAIDPGVEKRWTSKEKNRLFPFKAKTEETDIHRWQILLAQPDITPKEFSKRVSENPLPTDSKYPVEDEQLDEAKAKKEPIYLKNAGIILLHPFLNILFEAVGLAKDQKVLDEDRTASLLHYLATGEEDGNEWDMVMPKVLLGVKLNKALKFKKLPKDTKQEAQQLLETVIQHWSVLGKTSIDGFRDSFLQRPGRLSVLSDKLYLKVEQRPYDLLMDQLPWGINYILLPWMPMPLHIEWV